VTIIIINIKYSNYIIYQLNNNNNYFQLIIKLIKILRIIIMQVIIKSYKY